MFDIRDYGEGIVAFDTGYVRPLLAAIHMIVADGRVAFVDTGCNDSLPHALATLARFGLRPDSVDYVIPTHVHLDHAGGAGAMMRTFPNAKLIIHPRGARHMAEPSKLVAGVCAVYGEEYVSRVYGEIVPVPVERIVEAPDNFTVSLAGRELVCLDTPGHARHHLCVLDRRTGGIFSGDMFGLSYRELDVDGRAFLFPTTTPSQFEPEAMRCSVRRLLDLRPEAIYLTHYGRIGDIPDLGRDLLRRLDAVVGLAEAERNAGPARHERIKAAMGAYLLAEARAHGCTLSDADVLGLWASDIELNTQGIGLWLDSLA